MKGDSISKIPITRLHLSDEEKSRLYPILEHFQGYDTSRIKVLATAIVLFVLLTMPITQRILTKLGGNWGWYIQLVGFVVLMFIVPNLLDKIIK